jgi:hypothetical protein
MAKGSIGILWHPKRRGLVSEVRSELIILPFEPEPGLPNVYSRSTPFLRGPPRLLEHRRRIPSLDAMYVAPPKMTHCRFQWVREESEPIMNQQYFIQHTVSSSRRTKSAEK